MISVVVSLRCCFRFIFALDVDGCTRLAQYMAGKIYRNGLISFLVTPKLLRSIAHVRETAQAGIAEVWRSMKTLNSTRW